MSYPRLVRPAKISFGITEACPLNCRHCYADCAAGPKPGERGIAEWHGLADQVIEDGVIQIYIEGGEPLLKPGLVGLLAHCAERAMVLLRTHATLVDAPMAARLLAAGIGRVLVDLMGADAATHDAATGTRGSFAASCAGLRHLAAAGIATDVLVILTRQTAPQLNAILRLAASLGAERVGILRLYPLGRARAAWPELALSLAAQMAALAALDPPAGLGVMQSWHPRDRNCCWQAAAVNAAGRAIGCMYLRDDVDFGPVLGAQAVPYRDVWDHHPLYLRLRGGDGIKADCHDCSGDDGSRGGCRSTAHAFHGRWDAPDPFDAPLNAGVDLTQLPGAMRHG
jgi:MoaA/NifB/PqqE/SkfB family radical SAM enzyme